MGQEVKCACDCGIVYTMQGTGSFCPGCLSPAFGTARKHAETAPEFADRMADFIKTSGEIASLPEVER